MLAEKGIGLVVEVDDSFPANCLWFVPLEAVKEMIEKEEWGEA
jgi:hypothetical protein